MKRTIILIGLLSAAYTAFGQGVKVSGWTSTTDPAAARSALGVDNGSTITNYNALLSTNNQTQGYQWLASPLPQLAVNSWNVWQAEFCHSNIAFSPYGTNSEKWFTNLLPIIRSNLLDYGFDTIIIDDNWQAWSRDSSNKLTWDTNFIKLGIPTWAEMAHTNGLKLEIYSAFGIQTCVGKPGSFITNAYKDVQTFMSWGLDGIKWDACDNPQGLPWSTNRQYLRAFIRTINQAIADYHGVVSSTNGIVRPFYMCFNPSSDLTKPDYFDIDQIFGVNELAFANNIGASYDYGVTFVNCVDGGRSCIKKRSWIGPGRSLEPGLSVPTQSGRAVWTNVFNTFAMTAQHLQYGLGTRIGDFNQADATLGWNDLTNTVIPIFQRREIVQGIWKDPARVCAYVAWTNSSTGGELWVRPLGRVEPSPNNALLLINNHATTTKTLTVNVKDFGGVSNRLYTIRDPWNELNVSNFVNAFSFDVGAASMRLVRVDPAYGIDTAQGAVTAGSYGLVTNATYNLIDMKKGAVLTNASANIVFSGLTNIDDSQYQKVEVFINPNGSSRTVIYPGSWGSSQSTNVYTVPSGASAKLKVERWPNQATNAELTVYVAAGATEVTAVTGQTLGSVHSGYDGGVGMKFTANNNMTVTALGRWVISGNSHTHTIRLVNSSCVELGNVTVNTSGATAGQFLYGTLASTIALTSGQSYFLLSDEVNFQDQFYDSPGTTVTTTSDVTVNDAVYSPGCNLGGAGAGHTYVPVSFKYVGSPSGSGVPGGSIVVNGDPRNLSFLGSLQLASVLYATNGLTIMSNTLASIPSSLPPGAVHIFSSNGILFKVQVGPTGTRTTNGL